MAHYPLTVGALQAEDEDLGVFSSSEPLVVPPEEQVSTPAEVAALVKRSRRITVLSGAGVSVESGVPPFRAPPDQDGAIWGEFNASKMTADGFNSSDEAAEGWWRLKRCAGTLSAWLSTF